MTDERSLVRELRKARNLTQEQLADLSGVDQATLSRLENNDLPNPTYRTVRAIATILGVPMEALMGDGPNGNRRRAERRAGVSRRQRPEPRSGLDRRHV